MSNEQTPAVSTAELQEQIVSLTAERDELKGKVEHQSKELTEVRQEAADRRVKLREAEEKLNNAKSPEDYAALEASLNELNSKYTQTERDLNIARYAPNVPEDLRATVNWPESVEEIQSLAEKLSRYSQVPFEDSREAAGGLGMRNGGVEDSESYDPRKLAAEIVR